MALHREMFMKKESPSPSATSEEWRLVADDLLSEESDFYGKTYLEQLFSACHIHARAKY